MANVMCGSMKTLGVALDIAGTPKHILADTDKAISAQKLQFATENPIIKFDAPALTEITYLPIYAFPHTNVTQRNRWALDCIFEWSGKLEEYGQTAARSLARKFH
eukprot:8422939-Pyramimonas_sp.AAC.1